jgi:uncharacterized delta-60 repeat protein
VARLQPTGDFAGTNQLNLAIGLPLHHREVLTNLLQQIYDPASSQYHHYLTPQQFTEMFGPTEKDYRAVIAFAKANGLAVTATHPNRMVVDVRGSVANIEKALHVTLREYQHPREARRFHAPDREPSLELTIPVLRISGLDDYSLPRPCLVTKPQVSGQNAVPNSGSGPSGSYMGKDFRAAYAPAVTLDGTGQVVGLLQFDGYTASDIRYYENLAGLPNVTLSNVLIDGATGGPSGSGGEVEVSLDIEMAVSMATNLTQVIIYMAPNPSPWEDLLNRMANDNVAKQLSCSWYEPGAGSNAVTDQIFQQMAAQGQSFFTASGDYDAFTGLIPFPDDTPYITLVGGTTLTTSGAGGAWVSETVWNRGDGIGSGGGISTQYPIPSWQTNISMTSNQGSTTMRNVPDVALTAENVYVRADSQNYTVGGTSCAAPLWAGFTALINQQAVNNGETTIGFINPGVYSLGSSGSYGAAFHDITTGDNTSGSSPNKFYAVTGYDLCTGWGTPFGQGLIDALAGPPVPTPPNIITQPQSQTNVSGSAATFSVYAVGSFPLSYQWQFNGTNIVGATNTVLMLANVQPTNAGAYSVIVTNLYGATNSSNAMLTVLTLPPTITLQPTNQTAYAGFIASFNAMATGSLPLSYQWSLNGTNIAGATNTSLTLTNVQLNQAGNYTVLVTNLYGSVLSSNAVLTVYPVPACAPVPSGIVSWWRAEGNADDYIGGNNGTPAPDVAYGWGEVGQAFSLNTTNAFITIPASSTLDVGNSSGFTLEAWIFPTNVDAFHPILEWNQGFVGGNLGPQLWIGRIPGDTGVLFANVTDSSGVSHQLYSAVNTLVANQFQHVALTYDRTLGQATLYVNGINVAQANIGNITPQTSYNIYIGKRPNDVPGNWTYGSFFGGLIDEMSLYSRALSASEIQLIYIVGSGGKCYTPTPPQITTQPASQTVYAGLTASFNVTAIGTPPLSYQWSFNGTNIDGATNTTLTLTNVQLSQAGNYAVLVTNLYGSVLSSNAVLTVNPLPLCAPVSSGLVSWWPGEGNANDVAGTNNGVLQGGVSFTAGEVGEAFVFDGSTASIKVPASPGLTVGAGNGLTLETWVCPAAATLTQLQSIMEWNQGSGSQPIGSQLGISVFYDASLYANLLDTAGNGHLLNSDAGLMTTNFQHIAVTYDKTTGVAVLYRNGVVVTTANLGIFTPQTTYDFYIGARPAGPFANHFNGMIDEPSIYNRVLSAVEIQSIYNAGSAGKCSLTTPEITSQPTNQTITVGGTVNFSVTASGASPLSYQWSFNGTNIDGATNTTLTLTNVQLTQAGNYTVLVTNVYGSVLSSNAILTVVTAPYIITQPTNQTVTAGGTANFNVTAGGTLPLSYQWQFNSTNIAGATSSTLTLTNVQTSQAGNYAVLATNAYGSVLSSNAVLTVAPATTVPVITGFNPVSGTIGAVVTITGINFSPVASNNIVYFGAVRATVIAATATNLVVMVPGGATYAPITETVNGLTAYSGTAFSPTFIGAGNNISSNSFGTQVKLSVLTRQNDVTVADIDGDGKLDLIVPNIDNNSISIYRNISTNGVIGTNSFAAPVTIFVGSSPMQVAVGDLDGDGKLDLVVVNDSSGTVSVLRNTSTPGNISFAPKFDLAAASDCRSVLVRDLDGDGKPDIVIASAGSSLISVYQNLSTPGNLTTNSFAARVDYATGGSPLMVTAGDLKGDGKPDLVVGNNSMLSIFRNISTPGSISFATRQDVAVNSAWGVAIGDIDGDGQPDVVVANQNNNTVTVLRNTTTTMTNITFAAGVTFSTGNYPYWVALGDVNGDGKPDVVVADASGNTVSVFQNTSTPGSFGTNSLAPRVAFATGSGPREVVLADLDGDGRLDIVNANLNYGNNYVSIQQNVIPFAVGPTIITQPTNQTVVVGGTTSFSVTASGTSPLSYQWNFNGTNIVGATNTTLTLTNVQLSQAGNYTVLVTNICGSALSSNAILTVATAPYIITQPTNQTVTAGGTANFNVTAGGTPPLSYQWNFNGANIAGATNASLTLTNVQFYQAGNYAVLVTNLYGSVLSSNAVLTVNLPASSIPVITGFSPNSGTVGTVVTITGTNFSPVASNNIVYFGAVRATVTAATGTNLVVTVPTGATYAPITETVNGLTAFANNLFLPTFPGGGVFNSNSLSGPVILSAGSGPSLVVIKDLDGDGKPDVVVANVYDGTVYLYRNITTNGILAFASPVIFTIGGGNDSLWGLAVADLDGDGRPDIVVANRNYNNVSIFQNFCTPGNITSNSFGTRVDLPVAGMPRSVVVADLDGDGKPDIVTVDQASNVVSVLKNIGTSGIITTNSFAAPVNFAVGLSPVFMAIADLDGDGKPDVVIINFGDNNNPVSVLRNISTPGNIAFAPAVNFPGLPSSFNLAIGDLDGDGKLDLVVSSFSGGQAVSVYRNVSTPGNITTNSFAARVDFAVDGWANGVAIGDLDGDGRPDVAVVTQLPDHLSIFKNVSTPGSFTTNSLAVQVDFAAGYNPNGVAIGDLDGDGRSEVVFGNTYDGTVSIYQNAVPFEGTAPVIVSQPTNQMVNVGGTANFSVTASGTPPLGYQWNFNGANIAGATNTTLTLTNVQAGQAGDYAVLVTNLYGSALSSNAVLTVLSVSTVDTNFNPQASGYVYSTVIQPDGKIVIGGWFNSLGGQSRYNIGRVNADGTLDTSFNPGANGYYVNSLAVQTDGKIVVGGYFTMLGGQSRAYIGRLNADGSLDTSFNPGADNAVNTLAVQADGKIVVGGNFTMLGGQSRAYIGRLNADGSLDTSFNPGADNAVNTLAVQADGKIVVGGNFTMLGGQSRAYIGRLNADGSLDTSFNPGADAHVYSMMVQADGKIVVGGNFTMLGGQSRAYIGRLNADGSLDTGFNPGADNPVSTLAVQTDGKILAGGGFLTLGGQSRAYIGRLNADGTLDTTFNSSANNMVVSLAVQTDGKILAGGYFSKLDGQNCAYVGRLTPTIPTTQSLTFNGSTITWLRGGSNPEVWRTTFDSSTDGVNWAPLGAGTRIIGGWQLAGLGWPANTIPLLRARGFVVGGFSDGSGWFVETIVSPPFITNQPVSQTVAVGGTASFNVGASGFIPLDYQWNFNGTNITGATNTTLTLTNVQLSQAGDYAVLVTNAYGSVLSSNALLIVYALDHFAWNPIPSPRYANAPFAVTVLAKDATNGTIPYFTGSVNLSSTNGIAVAPSVSGNFIQGVWTGSVVIAQPAPNVVLQADDGLGHFGWANPINVINLPQLEMLYSGNIAVYMWPVGYSGFVLETSSSLSPPAWVVVPYTPLQVGDEYILPLDMNGTNGFYRLWFPGP